jgi:hypothetical protein
VIGSLSTSTPALDTGTFPVGSIVKIINNGSILGAGGKGGDGGAYYYGDGCTLGALAKPGAPGGPALRAQVSVTIVNNGKIWGGGGGGGGAIATISSQSENVGGSGGGGAGSVPGAGGPAGSSCYPSFCNLYAGSPGTLSSGGAGGKAYLWSGEANFWGAQGGQGGAPGQQGAVGESTPEYWLYNCSTAGAGGGAAGPAVTGNTLITWLPAGDRKGPIN